MRLREFFGLTVRLIGLFFATYGLYQLIGGLFQFGEGLWSVLYTSFPQRQGFGPWGSWVLSVISYQLPALLYILAGWLILRRSARIVAFAYRGAGTTCPECGYDLRASQERCPECGTAIERP